MSAPGNAFLEGSVAATMRDGAPRVPAGATLADAVEALLASPTSRAVYVVAPDGRVAGVVSYRTVLRAVNARLGARASGPASLVRYFRDLAADSVDRLMRPPNPVRAETPLAVALELMEELRENDLPVVDGEGRLVGELRGHDVLGLAAEVVRAGDDATADPAP